MKTDSNQEKLPSKSEQMVALASTTIVFTVCFAVWTIFSIIGVQIKQELGLSETQFSLLIGTPILTGSIIRLNLGIWADQYGGRPIFIITMISSAISTYLLTYANTYELLLLTALGVGIAGGSFTVGISYLSKLYDKKHQGTPLGIFGMGNIGAAVTKFVAPFIMVAYGWHMVAKIWAIVLLGSAVVFWLITKDEPEILERRKLGIKPKPLMDALQPLKNPQVWRFSLYYFFVFGGFVALALWLPRYYVGVYEVPIGVAGALAASFSVAGSLFRAIGGYLSDRYGARFVMYLTFIVCIICAFILSYPATDFIVHGAHGNISFHLGLGVVSFTLILFILGLFMSFGKAAIYCHIPIYFPDNVGSVAGIVGLVGGLGGFILPLLFGMLLDYTNIWTSCFMLLFGFVSVSLILMHMAIRSMEHAQNPSLRGPKFLIH